MSGVDVALMVSGLAFLAALVRVGLGPSVADRAAAVDVCLFAMVGGLALLAVRLEEDTFIDVVLVATLLGFVATVSLALLIERKR